LYKGLTKNIQKSFDCLYIVPLDSEKLKTLEVELSIYNALT